MVMLVYVFAVDLNRLFVIDLPETSILDDLRLAVTKCNPDVIKCPLRKLQLFCTKRDGSG